MERRSSLGSPRQALAAGIGMLHQEPLVCLPFTAAENFRLGSRRSVADSSAELVETGNQVRLPAGSIGRDQKPVDRRTPAAGNSEAAGGRDQGADPRRAHFGNHRQPEVRELFAALRRLAAEGLTVLFVSHKLEEVNELCTSVTVLRRGRVVGTSPLPRSEEDLVEMMFEQGSLIPTRAPATQGGSVVAELVSVDAGDERTGIHAGRSAGHGGRSHRAGGSGGKRSGSAVAGVGRDRPPIRGAGSTIGGRDIDPPGRSSLSRGRSLLSSRVVAWRRVFCRA